MDNKWVYHEQEGDNPVWLRSDAIDILTYLQLLRKEGQEWRVLAMIRGRSEVIKICSSEQECKDFITGLING